MSVRVDATAMPSLDAFDEEFGSDDRDSAGDGGPKTGFRLSTILMLALAAAAISALALGWPGTSGAPRQDDRTAIAAFLLPGEQPDAAIRRLAEEVRALKKENEQLVEEQQQATDTIAALRTNEQQPTPLISWYSDTTALMFGIPVREMTAAAPPPPPRRAATARPRPREVPRVVDDGVPVPLEPQQIDPQ